MTSFQDVSPNRAAPGLSQGIERLIDRFEFATLALWFRHPQRAALLVGLGALLLGALTAVAPFMALGAVVGVAGLTLLITILVRVPGAMSAVLLAIAAFDAITLPFGGVTFTKATGALVIGIWLLRRLVMRDRALPRHPLLLVAGFFILWAGASLLWGTYTDVALLRLQSLVLLGIATLIVADDLWAPDRFKALFDMAWIIGAVAGAFAIGFWLLNGGELGALTASGDQRAVGTVGEPNEYAMFQLTKLPFALMAFHLARGPWSRVIRVSALALILGAIGLTQSRSSLIGLGAVLVVALGVSPHFRPNWRQLTAGLALFAVVGLLFFLPAINRFSTTAETGFARERRPTLWRVAILAFETQPWFGIGLGNFAVPEMYFGFEDTLDTIRVANKALVVHNAYLEAAAELGIPGAVAFLALFGISLAESFRLARHRDRRYAAFGAAILAALVGHAIQMVFYSAQYDKSFWVILGATAGLSLASRRDHASQQGGAP